MRDRTLPIFEVEPALVDSAARHTRLVLRAPTGSGKSTQVPQFLLDHGLAGDGQIVVLQPRRIAARMLAARVARERDVELGGEVGYQIRFENRTGPHTRIRYVTEGLLLRQWSSDPALSGVGAILFDEFHERHLDGDLSLALALRLQESERPDLRLIVMSATLGLAPLEAYLRPCAVLESEGRRFPVDLRYLDRAPCEREDIWDTAVRALESLGGEAQGHTLIFMPGAYEIQRTIGALRESPAARGRILLPLHGELPPAEQDAAVAPSDRPKIIVATNVAETSLTIEGIRVVVDSGLARMAAFDPHRGINTLHIERISRASADQRAGRAGRTGPGLCLRLWTERDQHARALEETPEIRRVELSEAVLSLKAAGVGSRASVRWFEEPAPAAWDRAEQLLRDLGALDEAGDLTEPGRRMASFPAHPRFSRMLLEAGRRGAVRPIALCAALTQGRGLLIRRPGRDAEGARDDALGEDHASDFLRLMRAWHFARKNGYRVEACRALGIHAQAARAVEPVFEALLRIARAQGLEVSDLPPDDAELAKCILAGFADHVARRIDGGSLRCDLVHGRRGRLDDESAVRDADLIVASEVREIEGREVEVVLSLATAIRREWLEEVFPGEVTEQTEVSFHRVEKRVVADRTVAFRGLALESRRGAEPPAEAAAALLAEEVWKGNLTLRSWNEAIERFILRVNFLAAHAPDLGLPAIGGAERRLMIEQVCAGSVSYKDIKDADVGPVVRGWLTPAQGVLLDREAPERVELGNGFRARMLYVEQGPPRIAARVQELYGVRRLPRLARGRVTPAIEILAPNQRAVQITQDLEGFWRDTYPRIRQEFARKYPKHEWRDPADIGRPPEPKKPRAR